MWRVLTPGKADEVLVLPCMGSEAKMTAREASRKRQFAFSQTLPGSEIVQAQK
jgi:hypothetical protein